MSYYTPTTDQIREWFAEPRTPAEAMSPDAHYEAAEMFDRWLAEVERAAAEKALTEAADDIDRRRSEPGLVHLDVKYAGYYAGIRSGMDSSSKALRTRSDSYRRNEGEK